MRAWVGFGAEDERLLRALRPDLSPRLPALAEAFYAQVLANPTTRSVLADDAQVARLRATLQAWADELVSGPWDQAYYDRRVKIGQRHVQVGLPSRYMFLAMNVVRGFLCDLATEARGADAAATRVAIHKVTDLDLAVMTSSYVASREAKQLETLRDVLVAHLPSLAMLVDGGNSVVAATDRCLEFSGGASLEGRPLRQVLPAGILAGTRLEERIAEARATGRLVELPRVDVHSSSRRSVPKTRCIAGEVPTISP